MVLIFKKMLVMFIVWLSFKIQQKKNKRGTKKLAAKVTLLVE